MHNMLNIVTNQPDEGAAVLIRSCEPVAGEASIAARRGNVRGAAVSSGPGNVGAALALDRGFSGRALYRPRGLRVLDAEPPAQVLVGPRVGIAYATPEHQRAPWRFASGGTAYVTARKGLEPK
jgi:DNA-3-methyladenine glycosylase